MQPIIEAEYTGPRKPRPNHYSEIELPSQTLSPSSLWDRVISILSAAAACRQENSHEGQWRDEVIRPTISLAFELFCTGTNVVCKNV